jgi:hypothetical protein
MTEWSDRLKSVIIQSNTPDECNVLSSKPFWVDWYMSSLCSDTVFLSTLRWRVLVHKKKVKKVWSYVLHQQLLSVYGQNDCSHWPNIFLNMPRRGRRVDVCIAHTVCTRWILWKNSRYPPNHNLPPTLSDFSTSTLPTRALKPIYLTAFNSYEHIYAPNFLTSFVIP